VFRTSDIVLIAVMVSAAALTYKTKREAEEQLAAVQKIEAQIRYEEDTIDLLKADWSLLTQPSRLQKLAEVYKSQLELEPVNARQIVGLDDLPAKPVNIEDLSSQRLGGMADNSGKGPSGGKDPVVTGGIVQ
jgi:cell division protein FtsL